jgi:hypothetical protein
MVIKDVTLTRDKDSTTLTATCKLRKIGWDKIHVKLDDKKHADYAISDASPFAAALLMPSMKQGEDLIIKGSISRKLYEGMHEIMPVVVGWNIGFKTIKIKADALVEDTQKPTHTASCFSGGVDSFYTYLKHKKDKTKGGPVDTFILVRGFDIDPRNDELWEVTVKNIKAIAEKEKVELLIVETNIRAILEPILPRGDYSHGGCLAAIGLFLRNGLERIYIPASFSVAEQVPWGSHMDVDEHWSTEKTTFIHDGTESTRLEKIIKEVANSPVAQQYLRVCYMNTKSEYNCGHCDKCIRTMVAIYAAGTLDKMKTFPHTIDYDLVAEGPHVSSDGVYIAHGEITNLAYLKQKKLDPKLQEALETKIEKINNMRAGFKGQLIVRYAQFYQKVLYLDFAYGKSTIYAGLASIFGRKFADE